MWRSKVEFYGKVINASIHYEGPPLNGLCWTAFTPALRELDDGNQAVPLDQTELALVVYPPKQSSRFIFYVNANLFEKCRQLQEVDGLMVYQP